MGLEHKYKFCVYRGFLSAPEGAATPVSRCSGDESMQLEDFTYEVFEKFGKGQALGDYGYLCSMEYGVWEKSSNGAELRVQLNMDVEGPLREKGGDGSSAGLAAGGASSTGQTVAGGGSSAGVAAGHASAAGTAATLKIVMIDKGDGQPPIKKKFKSQFQYDKYLSNKGAECLRKVRCNPPEDGDVDDVEELDDDEMYELILKDKPLALKVEDHELHQRHLIDRREEEFFEAMTPIVAAEEGVTIGDVVKLPELRKIYSKDGKTMEVELDVVLRVDNGRNGPVMYVGSTKTYSNGDGDAKNLIGTIKEIKNASKRPDAPNGYRAFDGYKIRGAFMAEHLGPVGVKRVPSYCNLTGLLHLKRSSGSIIRAQLATARMIPTRAFKATIVRHI